MQPDADGGWQRLPATALLVLIVHGLIQFIRQNIYMVAGAGASVALLDRFGVKELIFLGLALVLLITLGALLYHRRFRFRMDPDSISVRSGLVQKKELRLRFARIQNIQINAPAYMRPFRLVRFSLESPGATQKEVQLPGISRPLAERMRDRIIAGRQDGNDVAVDTEKLADDMQPQEAGNLYSASTWRLFMHGLSSNQVWLILAAIAYISSQFAERLESSTVRMWLMAGPFNNIWLAAGLVFTALTILLLLSGLGAVIRYHDYRLQLRGNRLVAIAGLFDRSEQTLKREKITGLTIRQSPPGRLIGCRSLTVRQAVSSTREHQVRKTSFLVPGMGNDDQSLNDALLAGTGSQPVMAGIDPRFRGVILRRILGSLAVITAGLAWREADGFLVLALLVLMPFMAGMIHLRWIHWRWGVSSGLLWVEQGMLGRRTDVFSLDLIQQATVSQSIHQRRHKLGTLTLALPHGIIILPYLPIETIDQLTNQAVYLAETARLHRV